MTGSVKLIAVETSSRVGRVALAEDGRVVAEHEITAGMRHGRRLLPTIDEAVRRAGWSPKGIGLVAVGIGPGSFTGLRIAVMFARTAAWRTGAKVVGVPTLRAIAENAPAAERAIAVATDAQRGGVYWATYARADDGSLSQTSGEAVGPPQDVAQHLPREAYLLGGGLDRYGDLFAAWRRADEPLWWPRASVVAELAWAMHLRSEHTPAESLEPLYVRRPAPEEVRRRRERGGR